MESNEPSSFNVLEYYRKYSQDKKLLTYFRGNVNFETLSEVHENIMENPLSEANENIENPPVTIVEVTDCNEEPNVDLHSRPPLIGQDKYENVGLDDSEIVRTSPTSSVASNKKLEWDSGADIGYENYCKQKTLHKSLSLPTLTTNNYQESNRILLRLSPEGKITESGTQTQPKETSSESSEIQDRQSEIAISSSSSEYIQNPALVLGSSSSSTYVSKQSNGITSPSECNSEVQKNVLDFLHEKVGLPVAESTPVYKLKEINLTVFPSTTILKGTDVMRESGSNETYIKSTFNLNLTPTNKTLTSVTSATDNLKQVNDGFDISSHALNNKTYNTVHESKKSKHLCTNSPFVVECVESETLHKLAQDKIIQTIPVSFNSVGIQTDVQEYQNKFSDKYSSNKQSIYFFYHSDSEKEPSLRSLGTNTLSNITDQDILNCNSFEYLSADQHNINLKQNSFKSHKIVKSQSSNTSESDVNKNNTFTNKLKRSRAQPDLTIVPPDSDKFSTQNRMNSSRHSLGDLTANEQKNSSVLDISKNIDLIKKLIKSKKYNKNTKQYYIKKIVGNILNSNTNSETSANSDVSEEFKDKNNANESNFVSSKPEGVAQNFTSRPEQKQKYLQENLPWLPVQLHTNQYCSNKQLEVKTFSAEIFPETDTDKRFHSKQHSKFTLPTYNDVPQYKLQSKSDRSNINEVNQKVLPQPVQFSQSTLEQEDDFENKLHNFCNWKEAKTLSEQKLDQQQALERNIKNCGDIESSSHSDSDIVLNFPKKERENQINWINNEITHLNKLRNLLQKRNYKVDVNLLSKPQVGEMSDTKKSTSVYVITTEKSGDSNNAKKVDRRSKSSSESTCSKEEIINVEPVLHIHEPKMWHKNGRKYGTNVKYGNIIPTSCKCNKNRISNQECDEDICPYLTPSQSRKLTSMQDKEQLSETNGQLKEDIGIIDLTACAELKQAKLMSSKIYNQGSQPYSCIRRYVFELPLSSLAPKKTSVDVGKHKSEKRSIVKEQIISSDAYALNEISKDDDKKFTDVQRVDSDFDQKQSSKPSCNSFASSTETSAKGYSMLHAYDKDMQKKLKTSDLQKAKEASKIALSDEHRFDVEHSQSEAAKQSTSSFGSCPERSINDYSMLRTHDENLQKKVLECYDVQKTKEGSQRAGPNTQEIDSKLDKKEPTKQSRSKFELSKGKSVKDYSKLRKINADSQVADINMENIDLEVDQTKFSKRSTGSRESMKNYSKLRAYDRDLQKDDLEETKLSGIRIETDKIISNTSTEAEENFDKVTYSTDSGSSKIEKLGDNRRDSNVYNLNGMHRNNDVKYTEKHVLKTINMGLQTTHPNVERIDSEVSEKEPSKKSSDSFRLSIKGSLDNYRSSRTNDRGLQNENLRKSKLNEKQIETDKIKSTKTIEEFDKIKYNTGSSSSKSEEFSENRLKYVRKRQDKVFADAKSKKDEKIDDRNKTSLKMIEDGNIQNFEAFQKEKAQKEYKEVDDKTTLVEILNDDKKTNTEKMVQNNKLTQTSLTETDNKRTLSHSSSFISSYSQSESSSSESSYVYICPCCKKNKSRASALVSNLQRDIQPLLCQPCYNQNQLNNWSSNYQCPGHVCNCYTILKTETVQQIKKIVNELGDLERDQQFCTCSYAGKSKSKKYCTFCDYKRKGNHKKSVAYMLTFEQNGKEPQDESKRKYSVEEVKIKIPYPHKKKSKDDENKKRKTKENNHKQRKALKILSLQEYLCVNRPNFIENAEQRRNCMIELAYMREQRCQKYKQLLALSDGLSPINNKDDDLKSRRMFTSKKMKDITAQNYKKLPEVQQKLKDNKEKQIRKANRLLAGIFNKKLRENVLKGRHTLSTHTSVIQLIS